MTRREWCKRYLFFLAGLFINSFGVSFITKAALGTSPISSVPYTLSLGFSPTLGMFTLYMSIVLILIQMILLRKDFPRQYLLQIPVSFLFSWFIDMTMELLEFLSPSAYPAKVICLLLGCAILGFGVFMEMAAGVVMLPGECFVNAISRTFHTDFGRTKVAFDTSITVAAAIIGIVLYRELAGVREGTIVAAVLVGMIARRLNCTMGPRVNFLLVR
ncbi:YczE/YyaS/YitT family protein [Hungatella hathewayi]|uniref:YczE/YyaS/YitT family protein n=1 Tax=Hungatella hathewayi TaxID=154046 RepID=UPI003562DC67